MLFSIIITIVLWKYLTNHILTIMNSIIILLRKLTRQSVNIDMRSFVRKDNVKFSSMFICLVIIWYMSSQVLSLSFNGLLLNTFFNIKSIPVGNTLEDIRNNTELLIGGLQVYYLQWISSIRKFYISDIIERLDNDEEFFSNIRKGIENVINGKGVIILSSLYMKWVTHLARFYDNLLFISETKYLPDYISFVVHRHRNFTKFMKF